MITREKETYVPRQEGIYLARITSIDEAESNMGDRPYYLKWTFDLLEGPDRLGEIMGASGDKWNIKTKLYRWTKAAAGPVDVDAGFSDSMILGRTVKLVIKQVPSGDVVYDRVTDVLPVTPDELTKFPHVSPEAVGFSVEDVQF